MAHIDINWLLFECKDTKKYKKQRFLGLFLFHLVSFAVCETR